MSYPQTNPDVDASDGGEFWRLNTLLAASNSLLPTPGDIYECPQSAKAIVVGPQSDFARVQVTYMDKLVPTSLTNSFVISPDRAFFGLVQARNMPEQYPLARKGGRLLLSLADVYDTLYQPAGFNPANDRVRFIAPRLDVIAYFSSPPSIIPPRSDADHRFQYFQNPVAVGGASWTAIPFYGRRYGYFDMVNRSGGAVTFEMRGVTFSQVDTVTTPTEGGSETILVASGAVADNARVTKVILSTVDGMFDMILLKLIKAANPIGPCPMKFLTSDKER